METGGQTSHQLQRRHSSESGTVPNIAGHGITSDFHF